MKIPTHFRLRGFAVAMLAVSALIAAPAFAKGTLVYCSEGSPEGFQPQFFSTGEISPSSKPTTRPMSIVAYRLIAVPV